jgi:5'-3' exonuclease
VKKQLLTLLVDAASLIYRAYFAMPESVRAPDGTPVNAAHGFLDMLARLVTDHRPGFLACAWDDDWRPQWRVDLIGSYKSHRVAAAPEEQEESLEGQMELIAEILGLAGVSVVGAEGFEAEDVIGVLLARARGPVAIVSGDRDLFQLVRDPDVRVLYPKRGVSELIVVDEAEIERRYGIPGRAYADFAILRGDPSDGLPGVRGIGEKSAAALIVRYGSLAGVVKAAAAGAPLGPLAKVASALDYLERAERVVRITAEAPIGPVDIAIGARAPDPALAARAGDSGLKGPVGRLLSALGGSRPPAGLP